MELIRSPLWEKEEDEGTTVRGGGKCDATRGAFLSINREGHGFVSSAGKIGGGGRGSADEWRLDSD